MKAKVIYSIEKKDGKFVFLVFDGKSKKLLHEFELSMYDLMKLHQQTTFIMHKDATNFKFAALSLLLGILTDIPISFNETLHILEADKTLDEDMRRWVEKELEFLKDRDNDK